MQPLRLDDEFSQNLRTFNPDCIIVASYGKIIPDFIIEMPRYNTLNIHPSLLPLYRGPSPIQQPLLNGDSETGVCIIQLTHAMDAGPVLLREIVSISHDDCAGTLHDRLAHIGADLIVRAVELVREGHAEFIPQDESKASYCSKIVKNDGLINWDKPVIEIERQVRAMTPWPSAFSFLQPSGTRIIISKVRVIGNNALHCQPGSIVQADKHGFIVCAGDGTIAIERLRIAGKQEMDSSAFLRGHTVQSNMRLGNAHA